MSPVSDAPCSLFRRRAALFAGSVTLALASCRTETRAFHPVQNETPAACEARKSDLVRFIGGLPERPIRLDVATELPVSTLGVPPGAGAVLELGARSLRLDGADVAREALGERLGSARGVLYVAARPDATIAEVRSVLRATSSAVEPKLLVRTERSAGAFLSVPGASERARELAVELLAERDPKARAEHARRAYAELNACPAIADAVARVDGLSAGERWPALKTSLSGAVPSCPCATFDAAGLGVLLLAEQRAGTAALGTVPIAFLRDERCGATMPLRSVQRLLEQVEDFDAEWAGRFGDDAIRFETVVTNDRLLVQFCDALPGETLASLQKAKRTVWMRHASGACEGFRFEPLSPGAPMGTLRRTEPGGAAPLAFHYWQAAEEIDLFGPAPSDGSTKPTDQREWPCRASHKLVGIEPDFVAFETGRWFFDESSCRGASAGSVLGGCFAEHSTPAAP